MCSATVGAVKKSMQEWWICSHIPIICVSAILIGGHLSLRNTIFHFRRVLIFKKISLKMEIHTSSATLNSVYVVYVEVHIRQVYVTHGLCNPKDANVTKQKFAAIFWSYS